MVAIFTGLGAGFTRGSGTLLGGAGQLGSSLLGRGGESVSVNAASGNLLVSHQDEFLVGLGPDVAIARTYNSLSDAADGDNGDQWQQSTTRRVFGLTGTQDSAGSTVSRLGADGSVVVYAWDAARSAYVTKDGAGAFDTLTCASDVWTWRDGDTQATETYVQYGAGNWRIAAAADADGNGLTFSYNADKLDKVTTADGAWTQYAWSGNAITQVVTGYTDLATSTAKTLTRMRYGYDGQGRLQSVTTDLTPDDNAVSDANTYVVTYTYDGTSNRIASIAQTDGSLLQIAYDGSDRVQTLTQTVASGVTRVTTLAYGSGYTSVTGPDGQVTRLDYDGSGRLTKITAPPAASGATAQTVQFAYDADGNLDSVTDGAGKVTSYDYNASGNATLVTDPTGHTVTRSYDAQNRLITELTSGADRDGVNTAHYSQYVYDSEGHLRFAVNAAGQVSEYRYTAAGQLARTIQYAENRMTPPGAAAISLATAEAWVAGITDKSSVRITENSYDARGNVVLAKSFGIADSSGNPLTSEGVTTGHYVYDQKGQLIESWREGENHETFLYDGMGRLYSSSDRNGGTTTIVFADAATTTTITTAAGLSSISVYNKTGDLVSLTESGANTTAGTASYQYDASGRLRVVTDATGRKSYVYYDKAGRKVAEANHLGEVTEYLYDGAGRVAATVAYATVLSGSALTSMGNPASSADFVALRPSANAADVWSWTIYDDAGRAIQLIDNLGGTVRYEYDTEGKLAKTTAFYTRLTPAQLTAFRAAAPTTLQLPAAHAKDALSRVFYNKAGQQIGTLDGEGFLSETIRDGAGLEIQTTWYAAATNAADRASGSYALLKSGITASSADRVAYSVYDGQGLLRYSVNARGGITGYSYDDAGRLFKTTAYATEVALTDFTYDAVKAAIATNAADRTSWTVYDAAGRAAYTVDAEGGVAAFKYDTSGRVTKAVAYDNLYTSTIGLAALDSWVANSAQANDTKNRVTRNWYNARGEVIYSLDAENYVTGYAYDAEGRVLSTTRYGGSWVTVSDTTTIAQLAALLVGTPTSTAITVSQTYDNAGRVLTSTDGEGIITRNSYNTLGQLTDVTEAYGTGDAATTHYTYDGAGRVLTQTSAYGASEAATVTYAYDGLGNRTGVTDANGNTTTFTYDRLGQVLTSTNALNGVTAYVYDAFGNVVKVTTPGGEASYSYYDRLGRLVTTRDAENFVTRTIYNRFSEAIDVRHYATAFTGTPQIGLNPTGDPNASGTGPSPEVIAAYAYATQLQTTADAAATALATEQAALAATLANPLPFLQTKLAALQAQRATVQAQYDAANFLNRLLVYGPQLASIDSDIAKVNTNITRVNNGQGLDSWGTSQVNDAYNVSGLQTQYNTAQAAANQALADAQALETAQLGGGDFGPYSGATYAYDRLGRVKTKIDAEGYGESYSYDAFGQLGTFRRYPGAVSGTNYNETSFEYDRRGSLKKTIDAQGWYESYSYDAFGRQISVTAKSNSNAKTDGGTTTYEYYKNGLLKSETLPILAHNSAGSTTGAIKKSYVYDQRGNLRQLKEADGLAEQRVTTYTYDKLNRKLTTSSPAVSGLTINTVDNSVSSVSGSPVETITYDPNGNIIRIVDAVGAATVFYYDALNRKTSEINALGTVTTYAYDANGNVERVRVYEHALNMVQSSTGKNFSLVPYDLEGWAARVHRMYDIALGRLAVSTEVENWVYRAVNMYGNTATALESICSEILGDSGVQARLSPTNVTTFVTQMYQLGFGRNPTSAEVTTWVTALNNGSTTRGAMLAVFVDHQDHRARVDGTIAALEFGMANLDAIEPSKYRETIFTYDKLGRMLTSAVTLPSGYKTGVWNGSAWTNATTASLVTSYQYDYLGNVVKVTDPGGSSVFSYYDKLARKTAQLDQEGYLSTWTYDSEGNVLTERRYSTRFTGTPGTSGPPSVSTNANDRVTTYTYDKVGNRLSEARSSVVFHNGTGGTSTGTSSISYVYNGLGQVVRKTEATGEQFDYSYDAGGRLIQETRPAFTSNTGASVTPQLNYFYNGLGNLSRTVQAGNADASARITTYAYDAGGRLSSMVDAEGKTRSYRYDQAGRLVLEYYSRTVMASDGSTSTSVEGIGYRYDAMGRNLGQGFYKSTNSGVSWQFQTAANGADSTTIEYNAFGDVTKIKINGVTQQENAYDLAGRLWKSTSGDGLWKYFGYDKNGNQTLTITSAGANISGKTLAQAFAMVGQSDVNGTYTVYDKRNMATSVVEEGRQLADDTTVTLTTGRTYTAFGEFASETDAAGATITYTYNTMGRRIRVESPTISITMEDGTTRYVKPSEDFYYDASGRLVAMRDSNGTYATGGTATNGKSKGANTGNLTRLTLLAGTGYGGGEALVVRQTTADGGISETAYDILGNARKTRVLLSGDGSTPATDVWRTTEQAFDKLGRIIKATRPGASAGTYFYDSYAYDELGQLVEHGNSVMSTAPEGTTNFLDGNTEISTFDIQGRIVKSRAYGGDITETTYSWDASLEAAGTGLTDTGGWMKQTIYRNTLTTGVLTVIEKTDTYGRIITRTDLDGRLHNFSYNLAGWMTKTYNTIAGAAEINYSYYNTGQIRGQIGNAPETLYKYDEVGRRRYESVRSYNWQNGQWEYLKQATVIYDKLGRIAQFEDQGGPDIPYAKLVFGYDANGNVMSTASTYSPLDQYGDPGTQTTVTKYNLYDAGNRMVLADGELSGSAIVRGTGGKAIVYDKAGQRVAATITKTTYDPKYGYPVDQEVQEIYEYDAAGRLQNRKESLDGGTTVTLRSTFTYDGMGRVVTQKDFTVGSTTQTNFDKTVTYNDKGQVSFERTYTLVGADTIRADATYTYLDYDGNYALGQVGKIDTINYKNNNNSQAADTLLQYRYDLYEKATLSQSIYKPDKSQSTTYYNNYQIDSWGYTRQVDITDGRSRSVIIKHDENNQILSREEDELSYNRGNPRQIYYRFDGRQLGEISNDGTLNIDYQTSVERRSTVQPTSPGPFMNGSTAPTAYTDFNQHYDAINSYQQSSSTRSSYTVQGGETLQSIAASVWGDASLWYSIAEANGLTAGQQLTAGQTLVIPANVVRSHNNADTFKAYDPGKALGDISPTAASPAPAQAKKNKCGVFGMILLAVVAIAVTVVTAGAAVAAASTTSFASGLSTVLGTAVLGGTVAAGGIAGAVGGLGAIAIGAGSAALGSIVSQGVGVATGIQEKFSWKGVALAAIGGGVGGALAPGGILGDGGLFGATNSAGELVGGALGKVGSGVVRAGLSGITSSAVSQGIAIASGLQSSFSWSGLAAAGAAAASGAALGHSLAGDKGFLGIKAGANSLGNLALSSSASLLANAVTRSAIEGTSFGDNILIGVPDLVASLLMKVLTSEILQKPQDQVNQRPPTARARLAAIGTDGDPHGVHGLGRVADWPPPLPEGEVEVWNGPVTAEKAREAQDIWKSVSNDPKYSGVAEDWIKYWKMKEAGAAYVYFSESSSIVENSVEAFEVLKSGAGDIVKNIGMAAINELSNKLNKIQFDLDSITGNVVGFVNKLEESYNLSRDYIDSKIEGSWLENSVRPYLYFNDFSVSGISTIARGVGSLPSALAHPIDSFTGMIDGAALAIDRALVAENTPASVQAARAYAAVSNMSGREISTSLGNVGGEVVLLVGPGKLKGPLRFEARAYDIAAENIAPRKIAEFGACFVAGTPVHTPQGTAAIEELRPGDWVLAQPELGGERSARRIVRVVSFEDKPIWMVSYRDDIGNTETLRTTPNHPFWVDGLGWTAAEFLQPGHRLQLADGSGATVAAVADTGKRQSVFNFEVDGFHTYYVGELGVWVHNTNCAMIAPGSLPAIEESAVVSTLQHIDAGTTPAGSLAKKWGTQFKNWAGDLPGNQGPTSPYLEYRVAPSPGTSGAGTNRVVVNSQTGETYYTWTHYGDTGNPPFVQIR